MPDIEGIETFAGKVIHTTAGTTRYDLTGKRAAVIGTGATAVQLIPEIAQGRLGPHRLPAHRDLGERRSRTARSRRRCAQLFAACPSTQRAVRLGRHRDPRGDDGRRRAALQGAAARSTEVGRAGLPGGTCDARSRTPSCARKLTPTTRSAASGRRSPTTTTRRSPSRTCTSRRRRSRRIEPDGIVTADGRRTEIDVLAARDRLQPLGRQLPGDRDHRPRRPQPRQVVARQPLPGLRGHRDPVVPELRLAQHPVLLQRAVVLHDHRVADAAHGAAASGEMQQARRDDVRGHARRPTPSSSTG